MEHPVSTSVVIIVIIVCIDAVLNTRNSSLGLVFLILAFEIEEFLHQGLGLETKVVVVFLVLVLRKNF